VYQMRIVMWTPQCLACKAYVTESPALTLMKTQRDRHWFDVVAGADPCGGGVSGWF